MMLRCDRAALDTDQGILFCDDGGPCGKRLHCGDCPLMSQKEEKEFEIGQMVRIVGPTVTGFEYRLGECFVIEEKDSPNWYPGWCGKGYSRHGLYGVFPASSLEPIERDPDRLDAIERRLGSIEKRLQASEGKANNGATTDTPDEPPELHVGDYVEVVGQPFVTTGLPVGTIDRVSHSLPPFGCITLEGSSLWYPRRSLRKLSDEEIIAKIGWERKA